MKNKATKSILSIVAAIIVVVTIIGVVFNNVFLGNLKKEKASAQQHNKNITIKSYNGEEKLTDLEVPYDPQRIAVLDLSSLDMIDSLGLGDRVVGSTTTGIDYLSKYENNKDIVNLGNVKEADIEAVMESKPDVIFIGTRLAGIYDKLSKIAPVVYLKTQPEIGMVDSTKHNARIVASMFGKEKEVDKLFKGYKERIEKLKEAAKGKNAVIGLVTSGSVNLLGDTSRLSLIVNDIGFKNLGQSEIDPKESSSPHGKEVSFELLAKLNPDYIFIMDRDQAIRRKGAALASQVMDNEIVNSTKAAKDGHVVVLDDPGVWYMAEGGITALDRMISSVEKVLL